MTALDLIAAGGGYTGILSAAVGPNGKRYSHESGGGEGAALPLIASIDAALKPGGVFGRKDHGSPNSARGGGPC